MITSARLRHFIYSIAITADIEELPDDDKILSC